jgi:hypothetical protein
VSVACCQRFALAKYGEFIVGLPGGNALKKADYKINEKFV